MAEASTTERPDGLLWRIARLHPGWVTLIVWIGYCFAGVAHWMANLAHPVLAIAAFFGFMLLYMGYPLFALLFLPGRFHSKSPARAGRALAAFIALLMIFSAAMAAGAETLNAVIDAANSGDIAAFFALAISFPIAVAAMLYLLIGAALGLVEAEKGAAVRSARKFGTALQFCYLLFGVFFIHKRIRRLVTQQGKPDPIIDELPMERLVLKPMASGHLSLELTERPGWEDFERYAEELLRRLDGQVIKKGNSVGMHIWNVEIETVPLRLVYEDYPNQICLESDSYPGDILLRQLHARFSLAPAP